MSQEPPPASLDLDREKGLTITWHDGSSSFYPLAYLRRMSPSADMRQLRTEMATNPLVVVPDTGPSSALRATDAQLVGRYALRITFSDGHKTGLYSWDYLRSIDPQASSETP
ncbi:MAG: gamma-butyrobetaine hydroxylase-like domain-containing protein [Phycisphaerales bacterium JB064]